MRTIDPFLAPGLWGGAPMPAQSPMMTAGRSVSPPQPPAAIARPLASQGPISQGSLASLAGSVLGPRFHAWYGRSGRRTICSVYPVNADETGKGLPDFCWAIVIAARREQGRLHSLSVFAFGADEKRQDRVQDRVKEAVAAGTTEWHVHLLAQNEHERRAVLHDLKAQAL